MKKEELYESIMKGVRKDLHKILTEGEAAATNKPALNEPKVPAANVPAIAMKPINKILESAFHLKTKANTANVNKESNNSMYKSWSKPPIPKRT